MTLVGSTDPRIGTQSEVVAEETDPAEVDRLGAAAAEAAPWLEEAGREFRAGLRRMLVALGPVAVFRASNFRHGVGPRRGGAPSFHRSPSE